MVFEKASFEEFYCACGTSVDTEKELLQHVRDVHLFIWRVFVFLRQSYLPIKVFDLQAIGKEGKVGSS